MWGTESKLGCKVLFWRENWWEYPKAHQENRMVPPKPSGVMRRATFGKMGVKVRMEGHVQILGLPPTHSTPIIFLAIWSSMGETTRKQIKKEKVKEGKKEKGGGWKEKVDSFLQIISSSSLLAHNSDLAQKRPYLKAGRGVTYPPLCFGRTWGSLDLISLSWLEKCSAMEQSSSSPLSTSLTWVG